MNLKKILKLYRILVPLKLTQRDVFINNLNSNSLIEKIEALYDDDFLIIKKDGQRLSIRNENHSDYSVFRQIFNFEEYKLVASILEQNSYSQEEIIFVDGGSNVGYTTAYFFNKFKSIRSFCIEPSLENVNSLKKNIDLLENPNNVKIYQNALAGKAKINFVLDNSFRDGKDWSISTIESLVGPIKGITINEIISQNKLDYISLLKIDIEGAERFIFNEENDLSFLGKTKILAMEIHDEFNCRERIYEILKERNFVLIESGELIIGLNVNYIHV